MRQLSLLRTLMKADLDIYGRIYGEKLKPEDEAFIRHCKLDPADRPRRRGRLERLLGRGNGRRDTRTQELAERGRDRRRSGRPRVTTSAASLEEVSELTPGTRRVALPPFGWSFRDIR